MATIPTPKTTPNIDNELENKFRELHSLMLNPQAEQVLASIEAQDLQILAGESDARPLGWVAQLLLCENVEQAKALYGSDAETLNGLKAAASVFKGIQGRLVLELAKAHVHGLAAWLPTSSGYMLAQRWVTMSGIKPATLESLGFHGFEIRTSTDGRPEWGKLTVQELIEGVAANEAILANFAFRRALMTGMAYFYVWAFHQFGSSADDLDMLDAADELLLAAYGPEKARLADRSDVRSSEPAPTTNAPAKKKPASKVKAQQRGTDEYQRRQQDNDRRRGYVQEGGRRKK